MNQSVKIDAPGLQELNLGGAVMSRNALKDGFTDLQWYCHLARQSVFFSACSIEPYDEKRVRELANDVTFFAPDLLSGFDGATAAPNLSEGVLDQIVEHEYVDDLSPYPEKWSMVGTDIYQNPSLPLFRVKAVTLKNGTNQNGHRSVVLVLSTHSLFEGADLIKLSRSQVIDRSGELEKPKPVSPLRWMGYRILAAVLAPVQLVAAHIFAPRKADISYKSIVIERAKLKRVAGKLNISQQALMFALTTFSINEGGKGISKKSISTIFADLSKTEHFRTNDNFFQFRMIDLKLPVREDFVEYAKEVHAAIIRVDQGNKSSTQLLLNAMCGAHRKLQTVLPFLYTAQLFRFSAGYDLTLSLVPPQRIGTGFTRDLSEPLYSGTYHPGFNMCVFAPGRDYVTFNLCLREKHMNNINQIGVLLNELD